MRRRLPALLVLLLLLSPVCVRAASESVAGDRFRRAVLNGWGEAEAGGRWSPLGDPAALSVGAGSGRMTLAEAGAGRAAVQEGIVARDVELRASLTLDRLPAGGSVFGYLVARRSGDDEYRLKARIDGTGAVFLQATRVVDGEETGLGREVQAVGAVVAPGSTLHLRGAVIGRGPTQLRLAAWSDGTPQPAGWTIDEPDATPLLDRPGHPGLRTYVGSSVTALPLSVRFDDWSVTTSDALVTPSPTPSPTPGPTWPPDDTGVWAQDRFDRVTQDGWGAAAPGGAWVHAGPAADFGVDGQRGVLRTEPGATRSALLGIVGRETSVSLELRPDRTPMGGNAWLYVVPRLIRDGEEVRGRVRIAPDGAVSLGISVVTGGEERALGTEVRTAGLHVGPREPIRVRIEGSGGSPTRWAIRAWPAAEAEPEAWALEVEDGTPSLQGAGSIGLRAYLGRSVEDAGLTFLIDYLLVRSAAQRAADPVLAGAGDIAFCDSSSAEATARLLDDLPGGVFALGDLAYPDGTLREFAECYDPTWGRHRERTLPVVGNREYATAGAAGYFGYWGDQAHPPDGWYAVDLGTWRVYVLNSQCDVVGCAAGSRQLAWFRADLAANPRDCALALWHEPRFTSGPHGDTPDVAPLWEAAHAAGLELVVSGHDHDYERLLPMTPSGAVDPAHGVMQLVVGTGGGGGATFEAIRANSVVRDGDTYGVLRLTLRPDGYDWRFLPIEGGTFTDSGSRRCHAPPP